MTQETYSCWRSPDEAKASDAQHAMSATVRVIAPSVFMMRDLLPVVVFVVVVGVISRSCSRPCDCCSRVCDAICWGPIPAWLLDGQE